MQNGHGLPAQADQLLQAAAEQQRQQQQLQQILQATVQNPHTIKRANVSLCVLAKEGPGHVLLVALPSGERWDIALSPQAVASLARAADQEPAEEG